MGYRNPRNYFIQDPTAGAKAFEESFKETFTKIDDYYTGLKQTAQKKNQQVLAETQKLQDEINKMEKLGSNAKEGIRRMVMMKMNELKSSVTTEEGGIFKRAFTAKVSGPTPQEMTEAINGIKDFSSDLNKTLDMAYKFDDVKVDNGGKNFKYVKAMMNHLKENPDAIEYNYKDGKFDFELKFNHPIYGDQVLNRSVVSAMINEVDGSSVNKSSLDEMYKGRITALEGQVKSHVSEREKELKANNKTGLASGIDFATERVNNEVENMEDDRIESFYFNYSRVNKPEQQREAFKNLDNEIAQDINNQIESKPNYLKPKINAALMNLLNNPNSDEATFEREFDRLGLVGISKEDFSEAILDYRMDVVKESMMQDVISKGVISGVNVRKDTRFKYGGSSRASYRSTAKGSGENKDISAYIKTKGETFRGLLNNVFVNPDDPFAFAPKAQKSNMVGADADMIQGDNTIELSGPITRQDEKGSPMINSVNFDPNTNTLFAYYDTGKVKGQIQESPGKEFNVYKPQELQAFWQSITPEFEKGKSASTVLEGFKKEAEAMFDGANISKLEDDKMSEWFTWYENNGTNAKQKLIAHAANNPNLYSLTDKGVSHWFNFYQRNKTAIDLAEMKK